MPADLRARIEELTSRPFEQLSPERAIEVFDAFRNALEEGRYRAAERGPDGDWKVNSWVKKGLLLGFRLGELHDYSTDGFPFFDKDTYPLRELGEEDEIRLVPGGSAIRSGAYIAKGVICMPPMYINTGAYVDEDTMVDSHVLVGSCAQIGKRVHLSAAVQIGGVLEPAGALPVIVEDDAFIGGGCGVFDGCIVRRGAVLAPGVTITRSTVLIDLPKERAIRSGQGSPLIVPENAVVVPGSRPARSDFAQKHGISLYTPVIVKYRDDSTDSATALESALR